MIISTGELTPISNQTRKVTREKLLFLNFPLRFRRSKDEFRRII